MLVFLLVPIIGILGIVSYISYITARQAIDTEVRQKLGLLTREAAHEIETPLASKEALVNNLAILLSNKPFTGPEAVKLFADYKSQDAGIKNVFAGFADKRYLDAANWTPPAGYDPQTRGWYKTAINARDVAYSEVYTAQTTNELTSAIVKTLKVDGRITGVVGVSVAMTNLKDAAGRLKAGRSGFAFVLDEKGNFIHHPEYSFTDNIARIANGAFAGLSQNMLSGEPALQTAVFGDTTKLYASTPIGKTGWTLVLEVPQEEMLGSAVTLAQRAAFTSFIGALLICVISFSSPGRL